MPNVNCGSRSQSNFFVSQPIRFRTRPLCFGSLRTSASTIKRRAQLSVEAEVRREPKHKGLVRKRIGCDTKKFDCEREPQFTLGILYNCEFGEKGDDASTRFGSCAGNSGSW